METLDDLIDDDDELIIQAPHGAAVHSGETWTQPAGEASLPPAGPVYRVTLPLLPHEQAARIGGRAPETGGGFQAVGRRGGGSQGGLQAAAPGGSGKQEVCVEKFSQLRIRCVWLARQGGVRVGTPRGGGLPPRPLPCHVTDASPGTHTPASLSPRSRVMSSIIVDERLRESRVLRLSQLRCAPLQTGSSLKLSHSQHPPPNSGDTPGTWAVVAVLAERSGTKEGTNGRRYAVWCVLSLLSVPCRASDSDSRRAQDAERPG
jgi:hypothetical protein